MSDLRLMLWNVENLFIFLDDHQQEQNLSELSEEQWQSLSKATTPNKYLNKIFDLKKCIEENSPDILMLNEVGGIESIENFNRLFLNSEYQAHLIEGNSDRGIDVGYLVKKSIAYQFNVSTHKNKTINLRYSNDPADKKYYLSRDVSELSVSLNGRIEIICLLTHLKSKLDPEGIDKEGIIRRTAEAQLLSDIYLARNKTHPDIPIFVCGDFNGVLSDPRHSEFQYLRDNTDLVDALNFSENFKVEPRVTQVQFRLNHRTDYQFDYILLSPKFGDRVIPEKTYIDTYTDEFGHKKELPKTLHERFQLASDHYPVIVTLKMT